MANVIKITHFCRADQPQ